MNTAMHRLVGVYGVNGGLDKARQEGADPRLVEIARRFYEEATPELGVNYAGLCILNLPHRPLQSSQDIWKREIRRPDFSCALIVEPGILEVGGRLQQFGVPYGMTGRLIMIFLQKQALMTQSREVELGTTMYEWMKRLGVACGGANYRMLREQMLRLSACSVRFLWGARDESGQQVSGFKKDSIIEEGILMIDRAGSQEQPMLWRDRIVMSPTFYQALCERPVPIDLRAIRAINGSSRALDLYVWLAYRLHTLKKPMTIGWHALRDQFGEPQHRLDRFRERFLDSLKMALVVYPDAQVDYDSNALVLKPSPPAVPKRPQVSVPRLELVASRDGEV
jgi:hypothetical protein